MLNSTLPTIIDSDPGIDDVVALALAARSPELELASVVTTCGNAPIELTTRNARLVLELAGRLEVPVVAGSDRPLSRPAATAPERHGATGVGYAPVPAAGPVSPDPLALFRALMEVRDPVVLVTLGPLTNLARALQHDREAVRAKVRRHLGVFGTLGVPGSATRRADFNSWCDPEAADLVLRAKLGTEMLGLNVTRGMTLGEAEVAELEAAGDPLSRWLGQALRFQLRSGAGLRGEGGPGHGLKKDPVPGCVVNDVLAVSEAIAPGLVRFETRPLSVHLDGGEHRGHTMIDPRGTPTRVATAVGAGPVRTLLRERVFRE